MKISANTAPAEKLAVLFFIHGGGFVEGCGSDSLYGPDFIIEKGTILVTINYRVGILGFLSLNSNSISGNMGLKDQQLALQWIHANIGHFGGDNKRITIFGQSAGIQIDLYISYIFLCNFYFLKNKKKILGGASTHFHILSPESRKYFRNALAMSGAIYDYFAMSEENSHVNAAYEIAKEMGQPQSTLEQLITFLKNATVDDLTKYSTCNPFYGLAFCEFLPVIESTVWTIHMVLLLDFINFPFVLISIQEKMRRNHSLLRLSMKFTKSLRLMSMHGLATFQMYVFGGFYRCTFPLHTAKCFTQL